MPPVTVVTCPLDNLPAVARKILFGQTSSWTVVQPGAYRFNLQETEDVDNRKFIVRTVIHEEIGTEATFISP